MSRLEPVPQLVVGFAFVAALVEQAWLVAAILGVALLLEAARFIERALVEGDDARS